MMKLKYKNQSVLQICGIGTGGIETLVMELIQRLCSKNIDFEIYTTEPIDTTNKKMLEKIGVKLNFINEDKNKINYILDLYKLLRCNNYKVVHSHNLFSSGVNMFLAWLVGVPVRITHAHDTQTDVKSSLYRKIYEIAMRSLIRIFSTDLVAVSEEAACFVFGKKSINNKKTQIIFNGINLDKFQKEKYSEENGCKELGLKPNDIKFVSVARFAIEKNHRFLIDVFYETLKVIPNAHLTLVGDGELKVNIEQYVKVKGISDKVLFLGIRKDIPFILSAMDYFILPSLREGFGIVYLEAQAMGLHCFASDCIPKVADAGNISFISIKNTPLQWAKKIENVHNNKNTTTTNTNLPKTLRKFDIKIIEKKFIAIYKRE